MEHTVPPPRTPPMAASDEADRPELKLARAQGEAYERALNYMVKKEAHGAERRAGDYVVAYAVENAEGMYHREDGRLVWHNPTPDENAHVEVSVRDGADGRFIPGLTVVATLIGPDGQEIGTHEQPFLWHPWLYHYGRNWHVPASGTYTLRIHIEAPEFHRHDKENGTRYAEPAEVEFRDVKIKTGQKMS